MHEDGPHDNEFNERSIMRDLTSREEYLVFLSNESQSSRVRDHLQHYTFLYFRRSDSYICTYILSLQKIHSKK